MPKLPILSGAEIVRLLQRLGFVFIRQRGSHAILRRGSTGCVVPMHKEVKSGTLASVLRQAGITIEELTGAAE